MHVPLAHTEGGLTASLTRGSLAAGTVRTYVLADRITRASCFVCADSTEAIAPRGWIEAELPAMREWLEASDDPSLSRRARLREVKTHVVGPMCHVLWRWTTGDAVGPNMMTRNSYALNMGYVMQRAPVKPERAMLEANMGGDKKPSHEYFQSGHGKTVLAEAFLLRRADRGGCCGRPPRISTRLSWAGTHGSVASGMQSVAFTPASAIAAVFAATGQDLGMVGTSSMAQGTARRVDGGLHATIRFGGLEVGTVGGGTTLPSARDWLASIGCAGPGKVYRFAQIVGGGGALSRDQRLGCDGDRRQRELLPGPPRARRPPVIALVFAYETDDAAPFEDVYGPDGEWAQFFREGRRLSSAPSCCATSSMPGRYVVVDRWESREAYNEFVEQHREEYMRRVDETAFHYRQELRFGTFENVWAEERAGHPAAP